MNIIIILIKMNVINRIINLIINSIKIYFQVKMQYSKWTYIIIINNFKMTKAYRKSLVKMKIKRYLIFKVMSLLQNNQMKKY
jgi:hypothetical protein